MTVKAPALPVAPIEYDQKYQDQLNNILRQYFVALDNPGRIGGASTKPGTTEVIAGLNFSQPLGTSQVYSFATQDDLPYLRAGDVYIDTTANNVLKMKI